MVRDLNGPRTLLHHLQLTDHPLQPFRGTPQVHLFVGDGQPFPTQGFLVDQFHAVGQAVEDVSE
ncbi:hypothetical protein D3C78_1471430 [compost metagenome]